MQKRIINRLLKEQKILEKNKDFTLEIDPKNFNIWYLTFPCAEGSIYKGETYTLKFTFPNNYVK